MTEPRLGLLDAPARLLVLGGALGYLVARFAYLPSKVAEGADWQSVSMITASGILLGAFVTGGVWNMATTLSPAFRKLLGSKRREQAFIDHLGNSKNKS